MIYSRIQVLADSNTGEIERCGRTLCSPGYDLQGVLAALVKALELLELDIVAPAAGKVCVDGFNELIIYIDVCNACVVGEHAVQYTDVLRLDLDNKCAVIAKVALACLCYPRILEPAEVLLKLTECAVGNRLCVVCGQELGLFVLCALLACGRKCRVGGVNAVMLSSAQC